MIRSLGWEVEKMGGIVKDDDGKWFGVDDVGKACVDGRLEVAGFHSLCDDQGRRSGSLPEKYTRLW